MTPRSNVVPTRELANRMAHNILDDLRGLVARHAGAFRLIAETARAEEPDSTAGPGDAAAFLLARVYCEIVFANAVRDPEAACRATLARVLANERPDLIPIWLAATADSEGEGA